MPAADSTTPALLARLGRRIRQLREAVEPNQQAFAEAHGYDRNYWGRVERGQQNVSLTTLAKMAVALSVPMSELLVGVDGEGGSDLRD